MKKEKFLFSVLLVWELCAHVWSVDSVALIAADWVLFAADAPKVTVQSLRFLPIRLHTAPFSKKLKVHGRVRQTYHSRSVVAGMSRKLYVKRK